MLGDIDNHVNANRDTARISSRTTTGDVFDEEEDY